MKISQIIVETTAGATGAGSIAPVETAFTSTQSRNASIYGDKKVGSLFKGKKTKKPYANSITEGKVKELQMDLGKKPDGLSDVEFKKKYGKTKEEMRQSLRNDTKNADTKNKVEEAKLEEDDLVIIPGKGMKGKTGFVPKGQSRVDHEVEMARSDLVAAIKNAKSIYDMIENRSEEEGLEGWVQEKIIKASDYLNAVKEYYDEKTYQNEMTGGVIAAGGVGEGKKVDRMVKHIAKSERKLGHSKDEAEDIAWATANKRGMLDNKNKKKGK